MVEGNRVRSDSTSKMASPKGGKLPSNLEGPLAAGTYAVVSICIMLFNKALSTTYGFRYAKTLTAAQSLTTLLMMLLGRRLGWINFANFDVQVAKKVAPMSFLFICYVVISLAALRDVNMPMFTALRRTTVGFVMLGEFCVIGTVPGKKVLIAVAIMATGALYAAAHDLTYDPYGYLLVLSTNLSNALYIVFISKVKKSTNLDVLTLLYYNTVITLPFLLAYLAFGGELYEVLAFEYLYDPAFAFMFIGSMFLAFVLNWTSFRNTVINSPMTQTVTGQVKNFIAFLLSLMLFSDYVYNPNNMIGLGIGFSGGVMYGIVKLQQAIERNRAKQAASLADKMSGPVQTA